ncbi:HEAT repeat domain-containing protein [Marinicrinis lubricantis]|uniref:HEAT repeat domain-containing protein n=1 Tax=Marinicrinis lubricantis TaxID=2086470 RepID=A0ABW1INL0_9BACL
MMTKPLQLAVIYISATLLLLLCLLLYLLLRKSVENQMWRKVGELEKAYTLPLIHFLRKGVENEALHSDMSKVKKLTLENLLTRFSDLVCDEEIRDRIRAFAERHLLQTYQIRLNHRRWTVRMTTLVQIDKLGMKAMEPYIIQKTRKHLHNMPLDEKIQIYRTLASLGSAVVLELCFNEEEGWSDYQRRDILDRMPSALFDGIFKSFDSLSPSWKWAVIDTIGISRKTNWIPLVETFLHSEDVEIRIRSLKALCMFSDMPAKQQYMIHARSSYWEERMMAAKWFGVLKHEMYLPDLQELMTDLSWWVRSQAAQSILQYPDGRNVLHLIRSGHDDRYARDMAQEWLERGSEYGTLD